MMLQAAPLRHAGKHRIPALPLMTMVVPQRCQQEENERAIHGHSPPPHKHPLPSVSLPLPLHQLRSPTPQGRQRWWWRRDAGQTTSLGRLLATDDLYEGEVAKQDDGGGQGERREGIPERSSSVEAGSLEKEKIKERSVPKEASHWGESITVWDGTREASHGTVTREASHGTVTREASHGTVTREASHGTVTREASHGTVTREASQGTVTREASQGTVTREASQGIVTREAREWSMKPTVETVAKDVTDGAALITADTVTSYTEGAVTRHAGGNCRRNWEVTVTRHTEEPRIIGTAVDGRREALKRIQRVAKERECQQHRWHSSRPGQSPSPIVLSTSPPPGTRASAAVQPISLERWPSGEMAALGHRLLHGLGPSPWEAYKRGNVEQPTTSSGGVRATHGDSEPPGCEAACVTNLTRVRVTTRRVMMINGTSTLLEPWRPQQRQPQCRLTKPPLSLQTQLSPDADDIAARHVCNMFTDINEDCSQRREADTNESQSGSRHNYEKDRYGRRSLSDLYEVSQKEIRDKTSDKSSRTSTHSHKSGLRLLSGLVDGRLVDTLVRLVLMFMLVSRFSVTAAAASPTTFSLQQVANEQGGWGPAAFHLLEVDALRSPRNETSEGGHPPTLTPLELPGGHPQTLTPLELPTLMTKLDENSTENYDSKNDEPSPWSLTVANDETTSANGRSRDPTDATEATDSHGSRSGAPTDNPEETSSSGGWSRAPSDVSEETSSPAGRSRANREAFRADVDPRYAGRTVRMVGTTWELHRRLQKEREEAAARWAPVVWLHPQELYFPGDVHTFLAHVNTSDGAQAWERDGRSGRQYRLLPSGPDSEHMHLEAPIDTECCNCPVPSFLHGQRPLGGMGPPVYVHIHSCYAPEQHTAETSKIQYLLPPHSEGRSMRDQIHELQHPLPLPPRYRRRRRHHIIVRGRRDAQQAPDLAAEVPKRGNKMAVSSKPYDAEDQTTSESPLNNFVENNQTSDGARGEGEEDARAITKIGQFLKWNKVTLRKPQTKTPSLPDFKKTPRNSKDGRKIDDDPSVLNEAEDAHSGHHSQTKGVGDARSGAVTPVDQQESITTNTPNTIESSSSTSEAPSNKFLEDGSFDIRDDPSTTVVTVEHVSTDGPVTGDSGSQVTDEDSKHEKRNIASSSYYSYNEGSGQPFRQVASQGGQVPYPNTEGPTFYPPNTGGPNTGGHHSEKNTAIGTRGHHFTVTYWFFYPFNQGKAVCTSNVWLLGRVAKPLFHGKCLGQNIVMGNHVGDWEHVSIFFEHGYPKHLYISAHSFGALYTYRPKSSRFDYVSQDVREGLPVRAEFPKHLELEDGRLVLYSAKGSHGLWPEPGRHPYNSMVVPLADETGQGARWDTWQNLEMIDTVAQDDPESSSLSRQWLGFRGRWGNPSSNCHPGLLGFCELRDGPTGIPTKRLNFPCHVPKHYTFPNA